LVLVLAFLLGLALVLLCARPGWALEGGGQWGLLDPAGQGWGVVLFPRPGSGDPSGWRLRLTTHAPGLVLSHHRPLQLDDGLGHIWQLRNRSDELVPQGAAVLPSQSAQFDLDGLLPRPSEALPLHLRVPLDDGAMDLMLGAEPVAALSELPVPASPHAGSAEVLAP